MASDEPASLLRKRLAQIQTAEQRDKFKKQFQMDSGSEEGRLFTKAKKEGPEHFVSSNQPDVTWKVLIDNA